jgi:rare lipoprotein A
VASRCWPQLAGVLCLIGCQSVGTTQLAAPPARAPRADSARPAPEPRQARASEQAALRSRYAERPALQVLRGEATYYADSLAGRPTASGEPYDPGGFTAAHPSLPFGTVLRVRLVRQKDWVYVRVNDRGPVGHRGRILDLSRRAAEHLGLHRAGVLAVHAEVVEYGERRERPRTDRRR